MTLFGNPYIQSLLQKTVDWDKKPCRTPISLPWKNYVALVLFYYLPRRQRTLIVEITRRMDVSTASLCHRIRLMSASNFKPFMCPIVCVLKKWDPTFFFSRKTSEVIVKEVIKVTKTKSFFSEIILCREQRFDNKHIFVLLFVIPFCSCCERTLTLVLTSFGTF